MKVFYFAMILTSPTELDLDVDAHKLDYTVTMAQRNDDERKEKNEKQCDGHEAEDQEEDDDDDCCESFFQRRVPIVSEVNRIKKITREEMRIFHDSRKQQPDDMPIVIDEYETFEDHLKRMEKQDTRYPSVWK